MRPETEFVPHEEIGEIELAEQLSATEKRFASRIEQGISDSELEMLGGAMAEDLERLYGGNDRLLLAAPEILKFHSDFPEADPAMKKVLEVAANTIIDNNKKRGVFPEVKKAA